MAITSSLIKPTPWLSTDEGLQGCPQPQSASLGQRKVDSSLQPFLTTRGAVTFVWASLIANERGAGFIWPAFAS